MSDLTVQVLQKFILWDKLKPAAGLLFFLYSECVFMLVCRWRVSSCPATMNNFELFNLQFFSVKLQYIPG